MVSRRRGRSTYVDSGLRASIVAAVGVRVVGIIVLFDTIGAPVFDLARAPCFAIASVPSPRLCRTADVAPNAITELRGWSALPMLRLYLGKIPTPS